MCILESGPELLDSAFQRQTSGWRKDKILLSVCSFLAQLTTLMFSPISFPTIFLHQRTPCHPAEATGCNELQRHLHIFQDHCCYGSWFQTICTRVFDVRHQKLRWLGCWDGVQKMSRRSTSWMAKHIGDFGSDRESVKITCLLFLFIIWKLNSAEYEHIHVWYEFFEIKIVLQSESHSIDTRFTHKRQSIQNVFKHIVFNNRLDPYSNSSPVDRIPYVITITHSRK